MGKVIKVLTSPLSLIDKRLGAIVSGIALTTIGVITGNPALIAAGVSNISSGLAKSPKAPPANTDRLRASIDLRAPRKIVFGHTAMALDVHYQEFTGSDQEYLNSIIVGASHTVQSIDEIWFDQDKAWSSGGGVTSKFSGYLTVTTRAVGTSGNAFTITGSTSWVSSTCWLTGCAYFWLRYKLTGNSKKAQSPFSSSVTSRITVRGRGALLYDPRRDSTNGGSGSHRPNDQATWAWVNDDVGRNPALQLLWYLLGWKIGGKLAVGLGLPVARIDLASFIAAANICDETVSLAAGGTEPRYRADGVFSEADAPALVFENLLATMNGVLRDAGGQIALELLVDDLGSPVADFTEADVIGSFVWEQTPPLNETPNVVRGRYTDASDNALYQPLDYPDVALTSPDGIDRSTSFDLSMVQSASQAQRLAKQFLQRLQYPGTFAADFLASAWRVRVGSVVRLTFPALGFSNRLFRVAEHSIRPDAICPMTLREENADIYQWEEDEAPAVVPADPNVYDPINDPIVQAIDEVLSAAEAAQLAAEDAQAAADGLVTVFFEPTAPTAAESSIGDRWIDTDDDGREYVRITNITGGGVEVTAGGVAIDAVWGLAPDQRIGQALIDAATANGLASAAQVTADSKVLTFYDESTPTAEDLGDLWYKPSTKEIKRWDGSTWAAVGTHGAPSGSNVGGTAATVVEGGANAANNGVNSDGTIKTDKVDTGAIVSDAVSERPFVNLGSGFNLSTSNQLVLDITVPASVAGEPQKFTGAIDANASSYEGSQTTVNLTIQRCDVSGTFESTLVNDRQIGTFSDENISYGFSATFAFINTPTSTYRRYKIYARQVDSSASALQTSSFVQTEALKK